MSERDIKQALFDGVVKPRGGPFKPNPERILKPFDLKTSVAYGFCRHCSKARLN